MYKYYCYFDHFLQVPHISTPARTSPPPKFHGILKIGIKSTKITKFLKRLESIIRFAQ